MSYASTLGPYNPMVLLKYQQVPQQSRITATTSGLRDLPPPLVPLITKFMKLEKYGAELIDTCINQVST